MNTAFPVFLLQTYTENAGWRQFLFPAEQKIVRHMPPDILIRGPVEHDRIGRVRSAFQTFRNATTECQVPRTGEDDYPAAWVDCLKSHWTLRHGQRNPGRG